MTQAQRVLTIASAVQHPLLIELFMGELGFQLASRMLQNKKFVPTIQGMRTGIVELIPGFSSNFAKAVVDGNGEIEWPEDKVGLVEGSFDYFENMSTIALGLIPYINPEAMKNVAYIVHEERTKKDSDIAFPPKYSDELALAMKMRNGDREINYMDVLEELKHWMASKVVFHAMNGMRLIKDAGYNASFSPRTAITRMDIEKFLECHLNPRVEDVAAPVDHLDSVETGRGTDMSNDVNPWDIKNAISSNTDMFDIDADELPRLRMVQKAAFNYNSWLEQLPDYKALIDETLEETRKRAKEYLDNRTKAKSSIDAVAVSQ